MTAYFGYTDLELINLLKSGDQNAFTEIYNRYFRVLYLHAVRRLRDEDEARDVVQELFASLWLRRDTLQPRNNLSHFQYKLF